MNTPKSRLAFEDEDAVKPEEFRTAWETGIPADVIASRFGLNLKSVYNMRRSLGLEGRDPVPFDDPGSDLVMEARGC